MTRRRGSPPLRGLVLVAELDRARLLDLGEELVVRLGLAQPVDEELDALLGVEGREDAAQLPHDLQLLLREEDLLTPGAGGVDVDRGEDPAVRQPPVELEL